jgi:hypothetical protein
VQLLDPFQVDHRHDADQQVDVARDVDALVGIGAVQPFVEQHVGAVLDVDPRRERAGGLVGRGVVVVQVLPDLAAAAFGVGAEQRLEVLEQIGVGTEVAEVAVRRLGVLLPRAHRLPVVPMEGVALDDLRLDGLAAEDVLERVHHGRRAGARGTGDRDGRMLERHGQEAFTGPGLRVPDP